MLTERNEELMGEVKALESLRLRHLEAQDVQRIDGPSCDPSMTYESAVESDEVCCLASYILGQL